MRELKPIEAVHLDQLEAASLLESQFNELLNAYNNMVSCHRERREERLLTSRIADQPGIAAVPGLAPACFKVGSPARTSRGGACSATTAQETRQGHGRREAAAEERVR